MKPESMKASELVRKLQHEIEAHGDNDVSLHLPYDRSDRSTLGRFDNVGTVETCAGRCHILVEIS